MKSRIFFFVFFVSILFANTPDTPNYFKDLNTMYKHSIENVSGFYPELIGLSILTGGLIYKYDETIRDNLLNEDKSQFNSDILHAMTIPARWYGTNNINLGITFATAISSTYLYGKLFDNSKILETSFLLTESFFITGGIIELSKMFIGRARPFNNLGSKKFNSINMQNEYHSMPSGHAALAFSMATIIAMSSDSYLVKIPAYGFAVGAALQRVEFEKHWTSDVIIGGFVGYGISRFLYNNYSEKYKSKMTYQLTAKNGISLNFVIPL